MAGVLDYLIKPYLQKRVARATWRALRSLQQELSLLFSTVEALKSESSLITDNRVHDLMSTAKVFEGKLSDDGYAELLHEVISPRQIDLLLDSPHYPELESTRSSLLREVQTAYEELPKIRDEINQKIEGYLQRARDFNAWLEAQKTGIYISASTREHQVQKYQSVFDFFVDAKQEDHEAKAFIDNFTQLVKHRSRINQAIVDQGIQDPLLDDIDGKSLDRQQRVAVITDEDANLILAGAGSGKTLTISGKVKYLVQKKGIAPDKILLISFTNKSTVEMKTRIAQRLNIPADVYTFHKLGLSIIADAEGQKPDIAEDHELLDVMNQYLDEDMPQSEEQISYFVEFFATYLNIPFDPQKIDSLGQMHDAQANVDLETVKAKVARYVAGRTRELQGDLRTISGEKVRSVEETIIANFLFLHGVEYEYERPYEHHTADTDHRQYKPDFYLTKYEVYIEHFGVNKNMRAPWLSEMEEQRYLDDMKWKRELHRKHKTALIETYSAYNQDGTLIEKLAEALRKHGVTFTEVPILDVYHAIRQDTDARKLSEFTATISTFIGLFKSAGYAHTDFTRLHKENEGTFRGFERRRNFLFFSIVEPIYQKYQATLKEKGLIDFNDMINYATELVKENRVSPTYDYIIIDEYQDISQSRFRLINAIREQTHAKIMCVGDDWQSIFRFAGSDIRLFTNFGDYFGEHAVLRIEKTYRNSQELIDIAGAFVMQNPQQFRKTLVSGKRRAKPVQIRGYKDDYVAVLQDIIQEIAAKHGDASDVMLLGRNRFDDEVIHKCEHLSVSYDRVNDRKRVVDDRFPKLNMYFLTVHRSKGLEADNTILLNTSSRLLGFPNRLSDDPVLSWVLTDKDHYDHAEERRLFYVALTRTKNEVFLLAPDTHMSPFVKELIDKHGVSYLPPSHGESIYESPVCPKCKTGRLVIRYSGTTRFLGCTNYPTCDKTYRDLTILSKRVECPRCGGYMVKRRAPNGWSFYGCTNYPECTHTMKMVKAK